MTYRPLTLVELQGLVSQDVEISEYYGDFETTGDLEETLSHCGSFLMVRGGGVYFVHQSAKDFLLNLVPEPILPSGGLGEQHRILFSQSTRLLHKHLNRNPLSLKTLGPLAKEAVKEDCTPFIMVRYSCLYWADHLAEFLKHSSKFRHSKTLKEFVEKKFLNWLEALGYIGGVNHGIESLLEVEKHLERQGTAIQKDVVNLVHDASRFIRHVKGAIEYNPLQVYTTGLMLSPDTSIIRQLYEGRERSPCVTSWKRHSSGWDGRLLTLSRNYSSSQERGRLHPDIPNLVVTAPDGTRLASSFADLTASVHDITAGACLQSLALQTEASFDSMFDNHICSMAFSPPDGLQIAIGYASGFVRIWDLNTSNCTREFKYPGKAVIGRITALVFAPRDSNKLVAASSSGEIMVWDMRTCVCAQIFKQSGFVDEPISLAFEASNAKAMALVSVSSSGGKVWDLDRGKCIRTLDAWPLLDTKGDYVLIFAERGNKLMVEHQLSGETTLLFWDIPTGKLSYHDPLGKISISAAAFVPKNARQVAIGSDHIKIRDTVARTWLYKIESGPCKALAFTPSALRLVSASANGDITIWDWTLLASPSMREAHTSYIYSLQLSPNGRHLACSLYRGKRRFLEIWDTVDEKCLYTIRHKGMERSTFGYGGHELGSKAFSPDSSRMLLSTSASLTSILKIETGERLGRLDDPENYFQSAVFSRDGEKLATSNTSTHNSYIRIWDGVTGSPITKFNFYNRRFYRSNMVFSSDGSSLAYVYATDRVFDRVCLQVRNATTGLLLHDIRWECNKDLSMNVLLSFNSDGTGLVVATITSSIPCTSEIRELDLDSAETVSRHEIPFRVVELSQDGQFARFERDDRSGVLDVKTGETLCLDDIAALDGQSGFTSRLGLDLQTGYLTQNCRPILWLPSGMLNLGASSSASASDTIAFTTSDSNFAVVRVPS